MCMIPGIDFLGLARYSKRALANFPEGWALGAFSYVDGFGDALPGVEAIIRTGRCPVVRLHLLWKDDHKFGDKEANQAIVEAQRVNKLIKKYPHIDWRISPWCEHRAKKEDLVSLFAKLRVIFGDKVKLVNTPIKGGDVVEGVVNEFHAESKAPRIGGDIQFSTDGHAAEDIDIMGYRKAYAKSEVFFYWSPEFNCRHETNDTTPRPKRKHKPGKELIASIIALDGIPGKVKLPPRWLYKSHAENKGNGDPRANKPVLIAPLKAKKIDILALNGKRIGSLGYYGIFSDGRCRYYADTWGYKLSRKAVKLTGDTRVKLVVNGKEIGVVDPSFRAGSFRD